MMIFLKEEPPFNTSQNWKNTVFLYTKSAFQLLWPTQSHKRIILAISLVEQQSTTTNGEEVVILFADTLCQVNCIIIE
ncbi:unnamed protein product [Rhizophagus irregularis]|nr:unnamed protein product [Rhizophagus irregularis]